MLGAVFVEGGVNLAAAEDHAVDLIVGEDGVVFVSGIWDYPLEVRLASEVFNGRARERMTEEGF